MNGIRSGFISCTSGSVDDGILYHMNDVGILVNFPLYHRSKNVFTRLKNLITNKFDFYFASIFAQEDFKLVEYLWKITLPDISLEYDVQKWGYSGERIYWMETRVDLRPSLTLGQIVEYLVYGRIDYVLGMYIDDEGEITTNNYETILL